MKTAPAAIRRHPRLTLRGWLTVTDLIAALCAIWAVVGGWQENPSTLDALYRGAVVYIGVHLVAPMLRTGGTR
ncbi:hypothetical protein ACF1GX_30290 [Streptomyces albidoflavus]|uniref:hypothetical protein n=1 Tax=Actinomycetes TaxID=1760 RepID=UPI00337D2958